MPAPSFTNKYAIIRSAAAGVFAGTIIERRGDRVVLKNARRCWYWSGAATLSQLAIDGPQNPNDCKFPAEVPLIWIADVIEIIPATPAAKKAIAAVPVWKC